MNDLKLGMRLLRYAYGMKTNLALLVIFMAVDILCFVLELMGVETAYTGFGGYLLFGVGMVPVQFLFSLNTAGAVLSSPLRKKLQTSIPAFMSFLGVAAAYLLFVLQKLAAALIQPDRTGEICMQIIGTAFIGAAILAFEGILYKSLIAFCAMSFAMSFSVSFYFMVFSGWNVFGDKMASLMCSILLGFALITAGAAMGYGFLRLFYRKPVSPRYFGNLKSEL